jgi:hypothetical protein
MESRSPWILSTTGERERELSRAEAGRYRLPDDEVMKREGVRLDDLFVFLSKPSSRLTSVWEKRGAISCTLQVCRRVGLGVTGVTDDPTDWDDLLLFGEAPGQTLR